MGEYLLKNEKCDFCAYLSDLERDASRREDGAPWIHHDFHALILSRSWNDYLGTAHAGTMVHRPKAVGFEIRYCPECGRKLNIGEES